MIDGYRNLTFSEQQALATHLQTRIATPDGTLITVDEGLVLLLPALWLLGYETRFSCQGGDRDNYLNPDPEDGADSEGYLYFETDEMALSFFAVVYSLFPVEEYPFYYIDSRAVVRFCPQAITMFEYAIRHFSGDSSFGSEDIEKCLQAMILPEETEAERRLVKSLSGLLPG